jgi:hypothetical protein
MNEQKSDSRRVPQAEQLQHLKTTILKQWRSLPPQERATLLFELLHDVLESDVGQSVRRELGLGSVVETVNAVDEAVPTNWVHKDDLAYCRPVLAEKIKALDTSAVTYIAGKIGDALQETYWMAMGIILDDYLGSGDSLGDEDDEEDDEQL